MYLKLLLIKSWCVLEIYDDNDDSNSKISEHIMMTI
jgi:hypothetical protein